MNTAKKILSFILVLSLALSLFTVSASATGADSGPSGSSTAELQGGKSAKLIDRASNRYTVRVDVPGGDAEEVGHDEVILMVDGSYSGDGEWPAMKKAITTIGETVLNGEGTTQLTLMAFGMGDNIVLEHVKDADALAGTLGELPGYLLRGVSSTNCEAGFTGVAEYIANHDDTLKDAIVLYISDGGINTDETPRLFYNWAEYAPSADSVVHYALSGTSAAELNGVSREDAAAFTNEVWNAVYDHSEMDIAQEYPISEMERAFLQYDEDNGTTVRNSFLIAMKGSKYDHYPDVWERTYASVFALAECDGVEDLYLVRYQEDGRATWMPEAAAVSDADNIHYVQSASISTLVDTLSALMPELAKTPYNDVSVTDYMSKWVTLVPNSIRVLDGDTVIYAYNEEAGTYEWLIGEEARPTAKTPITVDLVPPAEYESGGDDVMGNTSGDIYKITWNIKDGALVRSDNYHLEYDITVDTDEFGFQYNTKYPANGNTDVHYTDGDGSEHTTPVDVPDVKVPRSKPDRDDDPKPDPRPAYRTVTVHYYDKDTGTKIADSFSVRQERNSAYDVSEQNAIAIDGYTYDSTDGDALSGVLDRNKVINVYYVRDVGDEVIIPDEDTPASGQPGESGEELADPDVPLSDVPQTGDTSFWFAMSIVSALALTALSFYDRKRRSI